MPICNCRGGPGCCILQRLRPSPPLKFDPDPWGYEGNPPTDTNR